MTSDQVLSLVFLALRRLNDDRIKSVEGDDTNSINLTIQDSQGEQLWVIDEDGIREVSSSEETCSSDDMMDGDFDSGMTSAGFGTDEDYDHYDCGDY